MRAAGSLYLMMIGLVLGATGGVFTWLMWRSYDRAADQQSWRQVPCRILECRIDERRIGPDRNAPAEFRFGVLYGYGWDGEARTSERFSLRGAQWNRNRNRAGALAARFPEGSAQTCHVSPADPALAVLERDSKAPLYSLWFPLLFVAGGLGMIASALRSLTRPG